MQLWSGMSTLGYRKVPILLRDIQCTPSGLFSRDAHGYGTSTSSIKTLLSRLLRLSASLGWPKPSTLLYTAIHGREMMNPTLKEGDCLLVALLGRVSEGGCSGFLP